MESLKILFVIAACVAVAAPQEVTPTPARWPQGAYGLPKPLSGCPSNEGFSSWNSGWRFHDTADVFPANEWSNPLHFDGSYAEQNMEHHFCMKEDVGGSSDSPEVWPAGDYCLYRAYHQACPVGFEQGWIFWDDEDALNANDYMPSVPHGEYDINTQMWYCCRNDGDANKYIRLPADKPFYMFKYMSNCQRVLGMRDSVEWFKWDCEDSLNKSTFWGSVPQMELNEKGDIMVYYCYYEPTRTNIKKPGA